MENFLTVEYLVAYGGFAFMFVLYLVADSKVRKLQRKSSSMMSLVSRCENLPVDAFDEDAKDDVYGTFSRVLSEMRDLRNIATGIRKKEVKK